MAFKDHLNDTVTYKHLSKPEAEDYVEDSKIRLAKWLDNSRKELNKQEVIYLEGSSEVEDLMPYFYLTMKVHKTLLKSRPIVSFPGSLFHGLASG